MIAVTDLRKIFSAQGIKGFSSANRAAFTAAIDEAHELALLSEASRESAKQVKPVAVAVELTDEEAAKKARRSRRGMVIVAKGTEVHKSQTFKAAAEAAGWTVTIDITARMVEEDGEFYEIECYTATAEQKGSIVVGSWVGRAWDYDGAYAGVGGKARKVRNLKEALRILAGQA